MQTNYIGPQSLKAMVDEQYFAISSNYHRSSPAVVIGPASRTRETLDSLGFNSQGESDLYIDRRMRILAENKGTVKEWLRSWMEKRPASLAAALPKDLSIAFQDLQRFWKKDGKSYYQTAAAARYHAGEDATFLDPYLSAVYFFGKDLGFKLPQHFDIPSLLSHELLHNDMAACKSKVEHRRLYAETNSFLEKYRRARYIASRGEAEIKAWMESGGEEFIENVLRLHGKMNVFEAMTREAERLVDLETALKREEDQLNITLVEEALAYNYGGGGKEVFELFVNDTSKRTAALGAARRVYDVLEQSIASQGMLQTSRQVMDAIDISWDEKRSAVEVLL